MLLLSFNRNIQNPTHPGARQCKNKYTGARPCQIHRIFIHKTSTFDCTQKVLSHIQMSREISISLNPGPRDLGKVKPHLLTKEQDNKNKEKHD